MEFRNTQLANGLEVVAEVNAAAATVALGFFVRTGSRDEAPDVSGVSHFLEHMVFKGTARRSAADISRELDEMGASCNAGTSCDNTIYYGTVLPEFQTRLLDVLCDILRPALMQEAFELEKAVILEEIAMLDDMPYYRLHEELARLHFDGHPLANTVQGTAESIKALRPDQMRAYFDGRYCPNNMAVVGVGRLDCDAFVAKVSGLCSDWPGREAARAAPSVQGRHEQRIIADGKVSREHIGLMCMAPAHQDHRRYAADLLAAIVGDVTGSRLYYALIDPALADEASMVYEAMDGAGDFFTFISADADRAGQALQAAKAELQRFCDDGPTEAELLAAKNRIASSATLKGELPMGRLGAVGYDWVYRRKYIPLGEQIEALFAVPADAVLELARECDLTATTVVALGPLESL